MVMVLNMLKTQVAQLNNIVCHFHWWEQIQLLRILVLKHIILDYFNCLTFLERI